MKETISRGGILQPVVAAKNLLMMFAVYILTATQLVALPLNRDTLEKRYVLTGVRMTQSYCESLSDSVWVVVDKRGDCLRYYGAGMDFSPSIAVVFFHGDRIVKKGVVGGYKDNVPYVLKLRMENWSFLYQMPVIFFARPGVYGSSGEHKKRRLIREAKLVNAALSEIKKGMP